LWLSRTGEQLSVRSLSTIVTAAMAAAGIDESAHALRHTVATRLIRDHAHDLVLVADILGHADMKNHASLRAFRPRATTRRTRRPRRLTVRPRVCHERRLRGRSPMAADRAEVPSFVTVEIGRDAGVLPVLRSCPTGYV
jgi:hypothetical protein